MISVAMIEPIGGHGGNEFYDFGLCEALCEAGIDVSLYTCRETTLDAKTSVKTRVCKEYVGVYGDANKFVRGCCYCRGTIRAVLDARKRGSRIAHFHLYHFNVLEYFNLWVFKKMGFHIVATVHDVESFENPDAVVNARRYRKFQKIIDSIIVHTDFSRKKILDYFKSFPVEKVNHILPLDFDFLYKTSLSQTEAREKIHLPLSGRIILFFGQIKKVKGLDVLLDAFKQVVSCMEDQVDLLIAGKTWKVEFSEYERLIQKLQLNDRVIRRVQYIDNRDVPLYFRAADVVVLPYRKIFNSSVLQRSLDYETPVIVSDLSPLTEIIKDGRNGLVFTSECSPELAEKLVAVLEQDQLREKLSRGGRQTVDTKYDRLKIAGQVKAIYEKLTGFGKE